VGDIDHLVLPSIKPAISLGLVLLSIMVCLFFSSMGQLIFFTHSQSYYNYGENIRVLQLLSYPLSCAP
jgi:hypothetical protein